MWASTAAGGCVSADGWAVGVTDRVTGIVIGILHYSPDVALGVLRTVSRHRRIRLCQVAVELVVRSSSGPATGRRDRT